jgi:cytochrome c oxidase subunit 2
MQRLSITAAFLAAALVCGCLHMSSTPMAEPALYAECKVCHTTKEMQRGPILNGQPYWYVQLQLEKYHKGVRGKDDSNRSEFLMGSAMSKIKSKKDIRLLAKYIAQLPPATHLSTIKGDARAGRDLYVACAACHGDAAEGKRIVKGPPIYNLEDWYMLDQLKKFKSGKRGSHADDKEGQIMAAAAKALTDQQMKDLVVYINQEFGTR